MKGFLFVFNSKEYKKSENVVVCISNSKRLTARFAKDYAKDARLSSKNLTVRFAKDYAKDARLSSKNLTVRFAKDYVTDAMLSPNSLPQGSQRTPLRRLG